MSADTTADALRLLDERLRDVAQHRALILRDVLAARPGARAELVASLRDEHELRTAALQLNTIIAADEAARERTPSC